MRRLRTSLRGFPWRLGKPPRPHDRYLLEEVIFPAISARADMRRILFVGCDWYTKDYPRRFADREFWTIDVDPAKARYGADRHIVDSLTNLGAHLEPAALDAVICNGVFGWGLDSAEDIDAAAAACHLALRDGGILVVGWNDIEPWRPPSFDTIESFRRLEPFTQPPFPAPVYPTLGEMRHVYSFYRRP